MSLKGNRGKIIFELLDSSSLNIFGKLTIGINIRIFLSLVDWVGSILNNQGHRF
jgi:phage-related holin